MRPVRCPLLVGRAGELAMLTELLDSAARGVGSVAAVVGEAGVGKSRLLDAFANASTSRGLAVAAARAVRTASAVPFRPWSIALASLVGRMSFPASPVLEPFRAPLGVLVPAWSDNVGKAPLDLVALGEGVLRLLGAVGDGAPVVVILEDLQWSDPDSLALAEYVADRAADEGVVLVMSAREELSPGLELVLDLERRRCATVVELQRLDDAQVAAMAAACLGEAPTAEVLDLLRRYADGLPFLVEELLTSVSREDGAMRPTIPRTFADDFRRRTVELGPDGADVLAAAALLGRSFDWTVVAAATGLGEERVLDVIRQASRLQILEEDGRLGSFRFRHGLSQEASLVGLLGPDRAATARRLLTVVLERRAAPEGDWRAVAAALAADAGDDALATALLVELAEEALAGGAIATAAQVASRASAIAPDPSSRASADRVVLRASTLAGDTERAAEVGDALLRSMAGSDARRGDFADVHLHLARAALVGSDTTHALAHIEAAEAAAGHGTTAATLVDVLRAQVALARHDARHARDRASAALEAARANGWHDISCEASEVLGRVERLTNWEGADSWFEEALEHADRAGHAVWRVRALTELGIQELFAGRAPDRLIAARDAAARVGAIVTAAHADLHLAALHGVRHEIDEGLEAVARCEESARRGRLRLLHAAALANHAILSSSVGAADEASRLVDEALAFADDDKESVANVRGFALVTTLLHRDERADARAAVESALEVLPPDSDAASGPVRDVATLLRALDGEVGVTEADDATVTVSSRHCLGRGFVLAAAAATRGRHGDPVAALELYTRAERELRNMPGWRNVVRRYVAEVARRDGWHDASAELLEAIAFFDGTGLTALADACRAIVRDSGRQPPRRTSLPPLPAPLAARGVTVREADVLALVAQGLQNRVIAERLYLSVRTVEKHVERLLAKTGTSTRAELATWAVRSVDT